MAAHRVLPLGGVTHNAQVNILKQVCLTCQKQTLPACQIIIVQWCKVIIEVEHMCRCRRHSQYCINYMHSVLPFNLSNWHKNALLLGSSNLVPEQGKKYSIFMFGTWFERSPKEWCAVLYARTHTPTELSSLSPASVSALLLFQQRSPSETPGRQGQLFLFCGNKSQGLNVTSCVSLWLSLLTY